MKPTPLLIDLPRIDLRRAPVVGQANENNSKRK